jgi:hypothetical protein
MTNKGSEDLNLEYVAKPKASVPSFIPPPANVDEKLTYYDELIQKESKMQKLKQLSKKNPFVPIGCVITGAILLNGIIAMKRGDKSKSQRMMRYRVAAQGITIMAVLGGTLLTQFIVGD